MELPGIKKEIRFVLLLMIIASTAAAADNGVDIASIDKEGPPRMERRAITPVVDEKYEYYEVRGVSESDLRCQMTQNGCAWDDGKKYDSVTSWHVKWDYGYDRSPGSCAADSFKAIVEITFRYPKWVRTEDAPTPLVDKWEAYMKSLAIHERGHRDMAVDAAAELSRAVAALPPAQDCADLDREVRTLSRERMNKLHADEKAYDAATSHGIKQGAVFP